MKIYSKTDIGKVRSTNQDAFYAKQITQSVGFAIVCDGMGGANAGNIASEIAVKAISAYILSSYRENMSGADIENMLKNSVISANIEIFEKSQENIELLGMGTTVVIAFVADNTAVIAHVGDSRAYHIGNGIKQITRDHSVVQNLLESGEITEEDAKTHPKKNVITRALGAEENIVSDITSVPLEEGESLLLCTDGLSNFVDETEMLEIFTNTDISNVAEQLVIRANDNGGADNITALTVTTDGQKG